MILLKLSKKYLTSLSKYVKVVSLRKNLGGTIFLVSNRKRAPRLAQSPRKSGIRVYHVCGAPDRTMYGCAERSLLWLLLKLSLRAILY